MSIPQSPLKGLLDKRVVAFHGLAPATRSAGGYMPIAPPKAGLAALDAPHPLGESLLDGTRSLSVGLRHNTHLELVERAG